MKDARDKKDDFTGELVWVEDVPDYFDFVRAYAYRFYNAEESYGRPNVSVRSDTEIYGWENVAYDGDDESEQVRWYFGLRSTDLGQEDFDLEEWFEYPYYAVDIVELHKGNLEFVDEPRPKFCVVKEEEELRYRLENIPEVVKYGEDVPDEICFSEVEVNDSVGVDFVLAGDGEERVTLYKNRGFSTITMMLMAKQIDSFSVPREVSKEMALDQL